MKRIGRHSNGSREADQQRNIHTHKALSNNENAFNVRVERVYVWETGSVSLQHKVKKKRCDSHYTQSNINDEENLQK